MRKKLLLLFLAIILVGCGGKEQQTSANNLENITDMTAKDVIEALKDSGLPITSFIDYTEETDPNELMNQPNQYTSKVNFADERIKQNDDEPIGGSLEIFVNNEDAIARQKHINKVGKIPFLGEYNYVEGNVLLRVSKKLTASQFDEYERAIIELMETGTIAKDKEILEEKNTEKIAKENEEKPIQKIEITDEVVEEIRKELPMHTNEDMTIESVDIKDKVVSVKAHFEYSGNETLKSASFESNISSITDYLLDLNMFDEYVIETNELNFTFRDEDKITNSFGSYFDTKEVTEKSMKHFAGEESVNENKEALENIALLMMEDSFEGLAEITLNREDKTFNIIPIGDVEKAIISLATTHQNDKNVRDSWDFMVENFTSMSKELSKTLPGYNLFMLNPTNKENTILWIIDGIVMYDFTNEF